VRQVGGSVSGFRVNADGTLAPVPGSPFKTDSGTAIVRSDPQGRFVFVGEDHITPEARGTNCLSEPSVLLVKKVDLSSGTLTQVNSVTLRGSCVEDMVVDPSGTHLYVGVSNITTSGGSIQGFLIGPAGTLTELPNSPVMVEDLPVSLAMHPTGKFMYAATPNLTVLDRNTTTGMLTVRGVFNTPKRHIALNPSGTFLTASERDTNEISEFVVDSGGNVTETFDDRKPANGPDGVGADPLGQFFVVTEFIDANNHGGLSILKQETPNGEYLKTNTTPFGNGNNPASPVFDPTGKFVYTSFAGDGTVQGFVLDRNTNKLTAIAKAIATGDNPISVIVVQPH
jgi:6-phosphogluconolactonase (cycloisomerase 2 family)